MASAEGIYRRLLVTYPLCGLTHKGYVATWSGGGDEARAALRASGQRIQRAAAQIIDAAGVAQEVAVVETDSGCDVCGLESHPDHAQHAGDWGKPWESLCSGESG